MDVLTNDGLYSKVAHILDGLWTRVDDEKTSQEKEREEVKKNDELETKLQEERELNERLLAGIARAERRGAVLAGLAGRAPALAKGDQVRLDQARDMYQIAKEITGIRWDFNAPPDVAKGYVRHESRRALEPFTEPASKASAALWPRLAPASGPSSKENLPPR